MRPVYIVNVHWYSVPRIAIRYTGGDAMRSLTRDAESLQLPIEELALVRRDTADHPRARVPLTVRVGGRSFITSQVFDSYWRFAAARQSVYLSRLAHLPGPW